jgi:hypothetical protein
MRRLELKFHNGRYDHRGVMRRIRYKIERSIEQGECVLLDGEDVVALSADQVRLLVAGLPPEKFRAIGFPSLRPFPLPLG